MAYELDFRIRAGDPAPINRIAEAVRAVADRTKISTGELKLWQDYVDRSVQAGGNLSRALAGAEKAFGSSTSALGRFTQNIKDYVRESERAEKQTAQTERGFARMMTYMGTSALPMGGVMPFGARGALASMLPGGMGGLALAGGGAAFTLVGAAAIKAASDVGHYAQEMSRLAERTGLTVNEAQRFSLSAQVLGVNAGALTTAMRTLSRSLVDGGEEGKKQGRVLSEMGILYQDALGRIKPIGPIIDEIFAKLGKMAAGPQRDFFANTLLGRGGLELIPLAGRLKEVGIEVGNTGAIMTDKGIESAKQYAEQLELVKLKAESLWHWLGQLAGTAAIALIPGGTGARPGTAGYASHYGELLQLNRERQDPFGLMFPRRGGPQFSSPLSPFMNSAMFPEGTAAFNQSIKMARTPEQNIAAGNALFQALRNREPLADKLKQAESELSGLPRPERGLSESDQSKRIKDLETAEKKVQAIKQQVEALKSYEQITKRLNELEEKATYAKFGGAYGQLVAQKDIELQQINQAKGLTRQQRFALTARAQGIFQPELAQEYSNLSKNLTDYDTKRGDRDAIKNLRLDERPELRDALQRFKTDEEIRKIGIAERQATLERSSSRQERISGLLFDKQPGAAALAAYSARIGLAEKLRDIELTSAKTLTDDEDKRLSIAKAESEFRKQSANILLDTETKILEIRQKERDQFANVVRGGFDALVSGGGRGLGQFARGQVIGVAGTVVSNAARDFLYPMIGHSLSIAKDPNSPLGKLFAGTAFGADPTSNLKVATDANTKATQDNTDALIRIASGGTAGADLSTLGRIPGLGTIFGGATNNPFIFNGVSGGRGIPGLSSLNGLSSTLGGIFNRSVQLGPGIATTVGSLVGAGIGVAGGTAGLISGLRSGGVQGSLTAGAGAAIVAGSILPLLSSTFALAGPAGMAAAGAMALVSAFIGDPKQNRSAHISHALERAQFYDPVQINASMDVSGNAVGYDRMGNARVSAGVSPYPSVQEPYYDFRHHILVPGTIGSPVGGPGPGAPPTIIINMPIHAIDAQSFADAAKRHSNAIVDGVIHGLNVRGRHDLVEALRPQL